MSADQIGKALTRLIDSFRRSNDMDDAMSQDVAELVQRGQLASAAETGVDRQHTMMM